MLASALILSACGSGGGGGETNQTIGSAGSQPNSSTLTGPNISPSQQTSVAYDTAISSSGHIQTSQGSDTIGVNCNGLKCRTSTGVSLDSSISLALKRYEKLQRNGRVNGPYEESGTLTIDGVTGNVTVYGYWMGDSIFGVTSENGYINGNYYTGQNASLMGDDTGSRPGGNATYTGKTVAIFVNDDFSSDGFHTGDVEYGDFYATYNFGENTIEMSLEFGWYDSENGEWDVELEPTLVKLDGSFSRGTYDGGNLEGSFFGNNHKEVAGTYDLPSESVVGAFGGIKD